MDEVSRLSCSKEAKMVADILDDCIIKLTILGDRLLVPAMQPDITSYRTLEERFGKPDPKIHSSQGSYPASLVSLQKDRYVDGKWMGSSILWILKPQSPHIQIMYPSSATFNIDVRHILQETINELRENKSFDYLQEKVNQFEREHQEERQLLSELAQLGLTAPGLKKQLSTAKSQAQAEVRQSQKTLAQIQDQVARVSSECANQKLFAAQWEETREGQLNIALAKTEEDIETEIDKLSQETDIELCVHAEMESYLEAATVDIQEQVSFWTEKLANDKIENEQKLAALKEKRDKNAQELLQLEKVFRQHRKELRAYESIRIRRLQTLEKIRFETDKATKIQAWWRGIMVRRGLGPYKRKKKAIKDKAKRKGY